jgi:tyrosine-protein phosphatase SIW14
MAGHARWALCALILSLVAVVPVVYYRASYAHAKRLRVVVPGKVYRSGQMTAEGFEDAIRRFGIKTVVNLQDEYPDPRLTETYFDRDKVAETAVCAKMGARYVFIAPDLLPPRQVPDRRPAAVEKLLAVFDDPASYPVLVHCRAGLHRTGCAVAVYRMEYQGWSPGRAIEEMKEHGFGDRACTTSNEYVRQYVSTYRRGVRKQDGAKD